MSTPLRTRRVNRRSQNGKTPPLPPALSLSPQASRQSAEQIWDEGVKRIVQREQTRDQQQPAASPDLNNGRCSEATLLDVINVYHHENSPGGPGTTPDMPSNEFAYHPRSPRNRPRFGANHPEEKKRSDSAVSVNETPSIHEYSAPVAQSTWIMPPRKQSLPSHARPSHPPVALSAFPKLTPPRRPHASSAASTSAKKPLHIRTTGLSLDVNRSTTQQSNINFVAEECSPTTTPHPRPAPVRRHTASSVQRKPVPLNLMPPCYQGSTKYSMALDTPLPSPSIDTTPVTTPPTSSHGNVAFRRPSQTPLTINTTVAMAQHDIKSAFDDDDEEDVEAGLVDWWKRGIRSKRASRERSPVTASLPVSPMQQVMEKRDQEVGRRRRKNSIWRCGCFGGRD